MPVRIYRPARNAMQSGRGKSDEWLLEFEAESKRPCDPLMGWTSSVDMKQQLRLVFPTKEEAVAYAEREGLAYTIYPEPREGIIRKSYSDNFKWGRSGNWTH